MRVHARIFSGNEGKPPTGENTMHSTTQLLTANELADLLRLRPDTIRLWTRESIIPAIRITGKVIRYDPVEVERALRDRSDRRATKGGAR